MTSVPPGFRRKGKFQLVRTPATGLQRVAFYYRVSTDEQAEQRTLDAQREYLHNRYAADFNGNGPVPMEFIAEYADDGWSGGIALKDRPAGERLLADAAAGKFDVLIIYKVDRLGRSARVLLDAHDELEAMGVALTSATEPFDTRPGPMQAIGKFIFQLLASIAELDRATIEARTMNGKHRVASEGEFVNGVVPYGFTVNADDRMVPNVAKVVEVGMRERDLIEEMFSRIADGQSCYAVADWLSDCGVPSVRRWYNKEHKRLTETQRLGPWSNERVWETIRNTAYKGYRCLNFNERTVEQPNERIVTAELWQRANDKMASNNTWSGERPSFTYLLGRKIRCHATLPSGERCGRLFTGSMSNKHPYYRCNGNGTKTVRERGVRCGALMIPVDKIEQAIWADLVWQVEHPEQALVNAQETLRNRSTRSVEQDVRRQDLRQQRDRLEVSRRHLRAKRSGGAATARELLELEEDLADNARAIASVDEQLAVVEAALDVTEIMERQYAGAATLLTGLRDELADIEACDDREAMRTILDRLITEIRVLNTRTLTWEVHWRFRPDPTHKVGEFTNIKTLCVFGEAPQDHQRQVLTAAE